MTVLASDHLAQATAHGRALPLTVLPAPHGPDRSIGSIGVGFRLGGEQTGGQVAIVEHPFPSGALVPPHVHTREDEFSIVTAGAIGSGRARTRWSSRPAATSASPAASCTRCGTPARTRPA